MATRKVNFMSYMLIFIMMLAVFFETCFAGNSPMIAIDPGHTKSSPGAMSSRGIPEYEFNVGLAEIIKQRFDDQGIPALVTRVNGSKNTLAQRVDQTRSAKFLLSVHHDSTQNQFLKEWEWQGKTCRAANDHFTGFSLFISRDNPYPARSLRCASAIGAALRQHGFHPSTYHAERIPGENREYADRENGVFFHDNLYVLKHSPCPAVLLEAGVIVNRNEEQWIQQSGTREKIALAIEEGLSSCGNYGGK